MIADKRLEALPHAEVLLREEGAPRHPHTEERLDDPSLDQCDAAYREEEYADERQADDQNEESSRQ